jgi:hypothetical protein
VGILAGVFGAAGSAKGILKGGSSVLKHGDEVADVAEAAVKNADDLSSSVYHVKSDKFAQDVLDKIDPDYFDEGNRFADGFYVAQKGDTAIAEVTHHGGNMAESKVIRFAMDESKLKTLDLTDPDIAKAWEYDKALKYEQKVVDGAIDGEVYEKSIELSAKARTEGFNAIKFPSKRGAKGATNTVVYDTPEIPIKSIFSPEMIMPATK